MGPRPWSSIAKFGGVADLCPLRLRGLGGLSQAGWVKPISNDRTHAGRDDAVVDPIELGPGVDRRSVFFAVHANVGVENAVKTNRLETGMVVSLFQGGLGLSQPAATGVFQISDIVGRLRKLCLTR